MWDLSMHKASFRREISVSADFPDFHELMPKAQRPCGPFTLEVYVLDDPAAGRCDETGDQDEWQDAHQHRQ